MTAFDVLAAIDAIVVDLQAQASSLGLGSFAVQKYAQPLWESAEMEKPLLAVYIKRVQPKVESTSGEYWFKDHICIGWFVPVPESLTDGIVDNAKARAAIVQAQAIYKYVAPTYFAGIPGYTTPGGPESEVTVSDIRYGKVMGGVYGCEIDLTVADWA